MTDKEAYWDENKPMTLTDAALLGKAAAERRVAALMQEKRELEAALAAEKDRVQAMIIAAQNLNESRDNLRAERDRYRAALEKIRDPETIGAATVFRHIADEALKER